MRLLALVSSFLGIGFAGYTDLIATDSLSSVSILLLMIGLFLINALPYLLTALGARRNITLRTTLLNVAFLAVDIKAFYECFVAPTSSTASLILLIAPLFKLLLLLPIGWLAGGLTQWAWARMAHTPKP